MHDLRVSKMNLTVHSSGILGDVKLDGPGRVYVHESLPLLEGNCHCQALRVELCRVRQHCNLVYCSVVYRCTAALYYTGMPQ